jgi:hypothetical protein
MNKLFLLLLSIYTVNAVSQTKLPSFFGDNIEILSIL